MRVVIAEDSVLLRAGLEQMLHDDGIEVVAGLGDTTELHDTVAELRPDLALLDIRMPPTHTDEGLRAALRIRAEHPGTAIMVLSQYVEERHALALVGDDARGIGYLIKSRVAYVDDFLEALRAVAAGGTRIDPEVAVQLLNRRHAGSLIDRLTPREREVLALMAEGRSNAAIGGRLRVGNRAVEKHVTGIFGKLELPDTPADHRRVLAVMAYLRDQ
ncbi:response regulator [Streptomyces sp. NPDC058357]|uniref:response regulator transcription factor n=1 Tax=unclassified Streptomyces TaxID=2593676 RepID=UPI003651F709